LRFYKVGALVEVLETLPGSVPEDRDERLMRPDEIIWYVKAKAVMQAATVLQQEWKTTEE
jgi:hypothetical protein